MRRFLRLVGLTRSLDQVGLAQFNIYEARTHFSRLVERAATGEEIVIARAGEPLAKLVPYRYEEERYPGVITAKVVLEQTPQLPRGRL